MAQRRCRQVRGHDSRCEDTGSGVEFTKQIFRRRAEHARPFAATRVFEGDSTPRTTPLRGLFTRYKGGFYHDGPFATLAAVVDHYDQHGGLGLSAAEKADLVEYLKSL